MTADEAKMLRTQKNIADTLETVSQTLELIRAQALQTSKRLPLPKIAEGPTKEHLELYCIFRNYVTHEAALVNNRLNWNVTIQGFLFAAYTFTLQKAAELKTNLLLHLRLSPGQTTLDIAFLNHAPGIRELHAAMIVMAAVGCLVGLGVAFSITAARIAQKTVQSKWFDVYKEYDPECQFKQDKKIKHTHGTYLPGVVGGGHPDTFKSGFIASTILLVTFVVAWPLLLIFTLGVFD